MAERIREPLAPTSSEGERQPDARAPAGPDLVKFRQLVMQAQEAKGLTQGQLATRVNDALIAMRKPGNDDAEATEVLLQLSLETLGALTDVKGRNCRKEAVETLMAMGFPHALKITPEDFEFARRSVVRERKETEPEQGPADTGVMIRIAGAALAIAGLLAPLAGSPWIPPAPELRFVSAVWAANGLGALAGVVALVRPGKSAQSRNNPPALLGLTAFMSIVPAIGLGLPGWIGSALLMGAAAAAAHDGARPVDP